MTEIEPRFDAPVGPRFLTLDQQREAVSLLREWDEYGYRQIDFVSRLRRDLYERTRAFLAELPANRQGGRGVIPDLSEWTPKPPMGHDELVNARWGVHGGADRTVREVSEAALYWLDQAYGWRIAAEGEA